MIKTNIGNEEQLLLLLAKKREFKDDEKAEIRSRIAKITDWDYFLKRSFETNLAPLIKRGFAKSSNLSIPEDVLQALKTYQQKIIVHNLQLYKALEDVGLALNKAAIDFIPLKGMMLAEIVYGDVGLRQTSDIDLLVKHEKVEACKDVLIHLGWTCKAVVWKNQDETNVKKAHPYVFRKGNAVIELHQHIHNYGMTYTVDIREYWDRANSLNFLKGKAYFLYPADLLQHLCLHTYKHLKGKEIKISSFVDFAEVINYYKDLIHWEQLRLNSIRYGCLPEVQGILAIAKKYWDAAVPDDFLNDCVTDDLILTEELFLQKLHKPFVENFNIYAFKQRLKAGNGRNSLKTLYEDIFPSKKFMINRYAIKHSISVYFYYIYRWWIIFGKIIRFIGWKLKTFFVRGK